MGMFSDLKDVNLKLRNDETLLRLLYYPPKNYDTGSPDPLDESLMNILDFEVTELRELRDKRIKLVAKDSDLVDEKICRLYLYAGRRSSSGNYLFANQEIIVDILVHEKFEKDLRSYKISDRVNELLVLERVVGVGQMNYVSGGQINAPRDYVGFRHVFEFVNFKK